MVLLRIQMWILNIHFPNPGEQNKYQIECAQAFSLAVFGEIQIKYKNQIDFVTTEIKCLQFTETAVQATVWSRRNVIRSNLPRSGHKRGNGFGNPETDSEDKKLGVRSAERLSALGQ